MTSIQFCPKTKKSVLIPVFMKKRAKRRAAQRFILRALEALPQKHSTLHYESLDHMLVTHPGLTYDVTRGVTTPQGYSSPEINVSSKP